MPFYDLVCPQGHEQLDRLLKLGERPPCPTCGEATKTLWRNVNGVIGDDIPGGLEIRHGLVNPDGSPRKFYSYSDIRKAEREAGLENLVRHAPGKGTDKSPFTVRWVSIPLDEEARIKRWHEHEAEITKQREDSAKSTS